MEPKKAHLIETESRMVANRREKEEEKFQANGNKKSPVILYYSLITGNNNSLYPLKKLEQILKVCSIKK